jgi:hypothetical protein
MKNNFSDLLTSIDVLNTLSGGISEPRVEYHQYVDRREIHINVPGVDNELIMIEINKNTLIIFYSIAIVSGNVTIPMPKVIYSKTIPYFVDLANIRAKSKGDGMVVTLPFNKLANGYQQNINQENE